MPKRNFGAWAKLSWRRPKVVSDKEFDDAWERSLGSPKKKTETTQDTQTTEPQDNTQ